ncbi:interleukin-18 receptor accessory protein-like, partial [Chelonoidis abingdonii]|uniref:interleukin-18 receptor accessory protein-like n=1 Tax=Chelonoidis abingdonii TaxID=106734 RepID=UPI0013F26E3E
NGIRVMFKEIRTSLKLKDDEINLLSTYEQDAGIYVCDYILSDNSIQWTMRRVVRVKIIARNTLHSPNILSPSGMKTLEVEVGKPFKIECKVFFGFESDFLPMITWYRDNKESKSEPLLQNTTR